MALSEERLEHIRCTLDALDEDVHGICTLRTIWWRDAMADLLSEHDRLAAEVERLRADNREMLVAIDKAYDDWEECDSPAYEELKRLVFKHWDALLALKAALRAAGLMEVNGGTV